MKVIFENGHERTYNNANNLTGNILFTKDPETGGKWVATLMEGKAIIEAMPADKVVLPKQNMSLNDALDRVLNEHHSGRPSWITASKLANLKKLLKNYNAKKDEWKD